MTRGNKHVARLKTQLNHIIVTNAVVINTNKLTRVEKRKRGKITKLEKRKEELHLLQISTHRGSFESAGLGSH